MAMQGDQYRQPINLTYDGETPVSPAELTELEVMVGCIRKTMSDGGIVFDESEKIFYVHLKQNETFTLCGDEEVQARLKFKSGDVMGIKLGTQHFEASRSKVVLK